jgi:threonine efflux protein
MSPVSLLLSLLAVDLLVVISPGPAFVVVSQTATRSGSRAGLAVVAGVTVAMWVWCGAVLSGLNVLFRLFPWLYGGMKILGGAYLIYLGIKLWRARGDADGMMPAGLSMRGGFAKGLLVGLTNPKAVVYFGSIFTLFVKPGSPLWLQGAAAGIATFDTVVWYSLVGVLFSQPLVRAVYGRIRRGVERAAGAVMVAFGARLLLARE